MAHNRDLLRYRCRTLIDDDEVQRPWKTHHVEPRQQADPTPPASD
jgi:hypothetical protein